MSSFSHHRCGVIIGSLYLVFFTCIFIFMCVDLIIHKGEHNENSLAIEKLLRPSLVNLMLCFVVQLTSGLLIVGILKKRLYFIIPWLVVCFAIFIYGSFLLLIFFLAKMFVDIIPDYGMIIMLILIILKILIYIYMVNLYGIIKAENNQNPRISTQDNPEVIYQAIERK
ncbi:uncharacterized protein ACRADG_012137 isoform 1-T1 [Cochliomyia hominivorax]